MPSVLPPVRPRRAHAAMRPTIFYHPAPRASHGGTPPCTPDDDGGCDECPRDDGARDGAPPFWRYLRALLEPVAMR